MHIVRHPAFRWMISICLLVLMAYQLWVRSDHFQTFHIESWKRSGWYIALVFVLMPVNWWLETLKWHGFLSVHARVGFRRAFKAVTSGIALSLFTPNRIGEYGGRILFMPYAVRWPVVFSTLMGSVSQNLVAFGMGTMAFILLFKGLILFKILGIALLALGAVAYFKMHQVIQWVCRWNLHKSFLRLINQLAFLKDYHSRLLFRSLVIAFLRYVVYISQFVLLLNAFEPQTSVAQLFLGVSCLYLFHTIIPMPPVADVLARTNIALILWSGTGMSELSISLASFIVWIINLLIPAILGSLAIGTIETDKPFKTNDSHFSPSFEPVVTDQSKVH
ncbi:MAG TPA: lysylphosphatidylglycerol synthase domain-containing protein [Saprospiraceae bacterium]|nr:lysylphosphatidylglycerol synthase domain-containing protein [Saprospiraceae bacterium]